MKLFIITPLTTLLVLNGCASMGQNERVRWSMTAAGVAAGAAGGAVFAPEDEKKEVHAFNWAGLIGLAAATYAMIFYSDRKELKKLKEENYVLKNKPDFELLDQFNARLKKPLFRGGPTEGDWQYQKIDNWLRLDDDTLVHQDRRFIRINKKEAKK